MARPYEWRTGQLHPLLGGRKLDPEQELCDDAVPAISPGRGSPLTPDLSRQLRPLADDP